MRLDPKQIVAKSVIRITLMGLSINLFQSLAAAGPANLENNMLYRPYRALDYFPSAVGLAYEDVQLKTADGVRLNAWFIPTQDTSAERSLRGEKGLHGLTLLYCHGNGGNISHRVDRAEIYHRLGLQTMLFDYRGYGRSEGTPNEKGTYEDAEAAWQYLTVEKKIPPSTIVLYGESLGCAVALEIALRHRPRALVMESGFTSTVAMAKRFFPQLPVDSIVKNRYDNLAKITRLQCPLLIMHSPSDQTIPFEMSEQLYAAAPGPKVLFKLRGSHYLGYHDTGSAYPTALQNFLMASI